ncbi:MAG TPA: dihydrolipoamide dehydrogenase [Flavobacteriaceae bacterium]|jgi:hypothetical protein|nr:dihydrolipoamide dehydrogenase [Flavobacteriaceae bacterium]
MKKLIFSFLLSVACSFGALAQIQTPAASPEQTLTQSVGLSSVTVQYSRPAMRGRTIFGDLVPLDKLWRTGANKNTLVTFESDATVGGSPLKAGTYALYTVPSKDEWTVYFYTDTENWGLPKPWDENKIAAVYNVKAQSLDTSVESFTITIDKVTDSGAHLTLSWENMSVAIPFGFDTVSAVMQTIERTMNGPAAGDYYQAAVYFLNADKDINKAKTWIDKAIAMSEKPAYWYYRQKALIYAKSGDKKGAIAAAERSMELAQAAGSQDYVAMNKKSLAEWTK